MDESGNELPKISEKYKAYEEVYENGKTFQLYTEGGISSRFRSNSGVTYALKKGSPTDVICRGKWIGSHIECKFEHTKRESHRRSNES